MIKTDSLLYELDLRLNKLSTFTNQSIPVEDKLIVLNNAMIKLIKQKVDGNNLYKLGLEGFKKRYQDLQFLIENAEDHKLNPKLSDPYLNKWIVNVENITPKYMFYLESYLLCSKEECKKRVVYTNAELVKHSDITTLLQSNNYKPSFEYQETFVDISSDEIHYYTDGNFTIDEARMSYIRYPKKIDKYGYIDFEGNPSIDQDCELEEYLKDELLDIAMLEIALYTENQSASNAANILKQINE